MLYLLLITFYSNIQRLLKPKLNTGHQIRHNNWLLQVRGVVLICYYDQQNPGQCEKVYLQNQVWSHERWCVNIVQAMWGAGELKQATIYKSQNKIWHASTKRPGRRSYIQCAVPCMYISKYVQYALIYTCMHQKLNTMFVIDIFECYEVLVNHSLVRSS